MKDYIEERAVSVAEFIIENNATVRQAAKKFGISKSTVHKDLKEKLVLIDKNLYFEVLVLLNFNKNIVLLKLKSNTETSN
mgnify:CR=1 FL=1